MEARTDQEMEIMSERIESMSGGQLLLDLADHLLNNNSVLGGEGKLVAMYDMISASGIRVEIDGRFFDVRVKEVQ